MTRLLSWMMVALLLITSNIGLAKHTNKPGFIVAPFTRATSIAPNSTVNILVITQNATGVTQTITNAVPVITNGRDVTAKILVNNCGTLQPNQSCALIGQLRAGKNPTYGDLNISMCSFNGTFCSKIAKPITFSVDKPVAIFVTPATESVASGTTLQYQAIGLFPDRRIQNITDSVTWSSSNKNVATISNASSTKGEANTLAAGSVTISASLDGVRGSASLSVTAATLTAIDVTPANPSIANGNTESFTATGIFSDGTYQDITTDVSWSSSNTNIATISNTAGSEGLATSHAVGSTTITATKGVVSGATNLQVSAAILTSISVTPTNPSTSIFTTQQFSATGIYSDNTSQDITDQVTWSTGSAAIAIASNASDSKGLVLGRGVGTTSVMAQLGSSIGSTTIRVTAAILESIDVEPIDDTLAVGNTVNYTATGIYDNHTTQDITDAVTWISSNGTTISISNAPDSQGLAHALQAGSATISAVKDSIVGSTGVTVTAPTLQTITVTPSNATIPNGTTQQYTALATYSDTSTEDVTDFVTWNSSAKPVAIISNAEDSNGLASGLSVGSTTISATLFGVSGSTTLNVSAAVLTSIAVTPASPTILKGTQAQMTATGTYSDASTKIITDESLWSSSTANATVSNAAGSKGLVTGVTAGSAVITANSDGINGSTTATITNGGIGDNFQGGKIACLGGGLNNLVAASADNSSGLTWGGVGTITRASSAANGSSNTQTIVGVLGASTAYAAGLCDAYEIDSAGNTPCQIGNTCYNDWFLPATNQLSCVLGNKNAVGGFNQVFYWSSREFSSQPNFSAWFGSTYDGSINAGNKADPLAVRCVRRIT